MENLLNYNIKLDINVNKVCTSATNLSIRSFFFHLFEVDAKGEIELKNPLCDIFYLLHYSLQYASRLLVGISKVVR